MSVMRFSPDSDEMRSAKEVLIKAGWEEQTDGMWILPDQYEWGMPLVEALRKQAQRDQWGN